MPLIKKITNKTTIVGFIVLLEFVGLYFAYTISTSRIQGNKKIIDDLKDIEYEIGQLNTTTQLAGDFFDKKDIFDTTFVEPNNFELTLKEIEAIRVASGIVDIDMSVEEGYNIDLEQLDVRSHLAKDHKSEFKDLDTIRMIITTKGGYDNSLNFIKGLENSIYINEIKSINLTKEELIDPKNPEAPSLGDYIEATVELEFYYISTEQK